MTAYASLQTVLDPTTGRYLGTNPLNLSPNGVIGSGDTLTIAAGHSLLFPGNQVLGDPAGAGGHTSLSVGNGGTLTCWGELTTYSLVKMTSVTAAIEIIDQNTGTVARWIVTSTSGQQASIQTNTNATGTVIQLKGNGRTRKVIMEGVAGTGALPVVQPGSFFLGLITDDAIIKNFGTWDTIRRWTSTRVDGSGYAVGDPTLIQAVASFKMALGTTGRDYINSTGPFVLNPTVNLACFTIAATFDEAVPTNRYFRWLGGSVPAATSGTPPSITVGGTDYRIGTMFLDQVTLNPTGANDKRWDVDRVVASSSYWAAWFLSTNGNAGHRFRKMQPICTQNGVSNPNIHIGRDTFNSTDMLVGPTIVDFCILDGMDKATSDGDMFVNGYGVKVLSGIMSKSAGNATDNIFVTATSEAYHMTFLRVGYGTGAGNTGADKMPFVISEGSHAVNKQPAIRYCLSRDTFTMYGIGNNADPGETRQASGVWKDNCYSFSASFLAANLLFTFQAPDGGPGPVGAGGLSALGGGGNRSVGTINTALGTTADATHTTQATGLTVYAGDTLYISGGARAGAAAMILSYNSGTGALVLGGRIRNAGGGIPPNGAQGITGLTAGDLSTIYAGLRTDGLTYGNGDFGGTDVRGPDPLFNNETFGYLSYDLAQGGPGTVDNIRAQIIKNTGFDQSGTPAAPVSAYGFQTMEDAWIFAATPTDPFYATNKAPDGKSYGAVDVSASVSLTAPVATPGSPAATSVPLTWTASTGGTAPITYTVQYRPGMSGTWLTSASGVAGTSATVTGLTQSTLYSFQIIATDAVAATATSAAVSATTTTLSTLVAPTVTLGTPTVSTLPITWTAATGGTAPYLYQVEYAPTPSVGTPTGWAAFGTWVSGTAATITGLLSGRTYSIRVVVRDVTGYEVTSAVITGTTTTPAPFVGQAARLTPQQNASVAALAGGTLYDFGNATAYGEAGFVLVTIANAAGGFSATFRGELAGTPVTVSSPQQSYYNQAAPTVLITGATAITANGTYKVPGTNLNTSMHKTAGTATVTFTLGVEP